MTTRENYERWLESDKIDAQTREQLRNMSKEEIDDAFFKDVEFGTAGMRGVLGPGTNRLNDFTVKKATVAFGRYLLELFPEAKKQGVVISHDNRHMSREFTLLSAKVLNDLGLKTYIFDSLRPTPELSFAVRYLGACGGIMITASPLHELGGVAPAADRPQDDAREGGRTPDRQRVAFRQGSA